MSPKILACLMLLIAGPAFAGTFESEGMGFEITVPDDFLTFDMGMEDGMLVAIASAEMGSDGQGRYQCAASFAAAPQASTLPQSEISAAMLSPARQAFLASQMGERYTVKGQQVFTNAGFGGTEFVMSGKDGAASGTYSFMAMVESAPGRTTLFCSMAEADLEAALPIFRGIRDSMVPVLH
jgi:hypothetical protein